MSADAVWDLDGRTLALLVAVVETRSVTQAAEHLGVTQSAVSHALEKLRELTGDPLVVKAGRGIAPTAHAEHMADRARTLLEDMQGLTRKPAFDPAACEASLLIAANPLQRDLLLPSLLSRLQAAAPGISLRVIPSDVPTMEMLRDRRCELVVSPRLPEGSDIWHEPLLEDRYRVFFDAACRAAPEGMHDYTAADHVTVVYDSDRALDVDRFLASRGVVRRFVASVPDFSGVAPFLRGSQRLATMPSRTAAHQLRDFAQAEVPVPCPPMTIHMIWHGRHHDDPMHRWLRQELRAVLTPALGPAGASAGRASLSAGGS